MSVNIILLVIGIGAIIFFLTYIEPFIFKQKVKSNNEYGSAKWSTKKEIKKNFKKEKIKKINEAGFPIYYSKHNKYVWFDR